MNARNPLALYLTMTLELPASTSFAAYSIPGADSSPEMGTAVTCPFRDSHRNIGRKCSYQPTYLCHQKVRCRFHVKENQIH